MIFVGDIAIPNEAQIGNIELPDTFKDTAVIANLEGAIAADDMTSINEKQVYNNDIVIDYLKKWNVKGVTLANNHITDVPQAFDRTKSLLSGDDIKFCGAGYTFKEAATPMWIEEDGKKICILAYGWDVISCRKPCRGNAGTNPLISEHILRSIRAIKDKYPNRLLYVVMHWDIELERYPMPAHRLLAMKMIDIGADAVIGHHPHCIQAYEIYKGKPVFYSLGNWMFPHDIFCGGRLSFPQYSYKELAIDIRENCTDIYSFTYTPSDNSLKYESVKRIDHEIKNYISEDYLGLSGNDYLIWFKANRQKSKGIPVYKRYDRCMENMVKDTWIKSRQVVVRQVRKYLKRSDV